MVSTSASTRSVIALLANHPEIQTRMQREIDEKIGEAEPRLKDRGEMHFTNAVRGPCNWYRSFQFGFWWYQPLKKTLAVVKANFSFLPDRSVETETLEAQVCDTVFPPPCTPFGVSRRATWSDSSPWPILRCLGRVSLQVIWEMIRYITVGPLVNHSATHDGELGGHFAPKNTEVRSSGWRPVTHMPVVVPLSVWICDMSRTGPRTSQDAVECDLKKKQQELTFCGKVKRKATENKHRVVHDQGHASFADLGWSFCHEPRPWILGGPLDLQPGEVPGWRGAAGGTWPPDQEKVRSTTSNANLQQRRIQWDQDLFDAVKCLNCLLFLGLVKRSNSTIFLSFPGCLLLELEEEHALERWSGRTDSSWLSHLCSKPSGFCLLKARWRPTMTPGLLGLP